MPPEQEPLPAAFASWTVPVRVDWLLAHMTLAEMVDQVNTSPRGTNKTYEQARNERFGLPGFVSVDGPRGPRRREGKTVGFPNALTLAASWDVALAEEVGTTFGQQTKQLGANQLFAPALNLIRHPQAGRNSEYLSEDPELTGRLAAALTRGIEGAGVIATPKHFAANGFETGRFRIDVTIPERVLREIYLPHFRTAILEGRPRSVMSAYNSVNGHYLPENKALLDILNNEWGFNGYVVSDYGAEFLTAAAGLAAGTHVEMPGWKWYNDEQIRRGLDDGTISRERWHQLLRRVLETKLDPRMYDPKRGPAPLPNLAVERALSRRVGAEGIVLLKNERGILPLAKDQRVALIGPFADSPLVMGNHNGSSTVVPERVVTIRQALQERLGERLRYATGCGALGENVESDAREDFTCRAEYFDNLELAGPPALVREETAIQKLSFGSGGLAETVPGALGQAFGFSGQGAMRIGTLPLIPEKRDFTLSFWVQLPDQFPKKDSCVFSAGLKDIGDLDITPAGLSLTMRYNRNDRRAFRLAFEIPHQRWVHLALVRQGAKVTVFLDGTEAASGEFAGSVLSLPYAFGGNAQGGREANCQIDEFGLYERALSAGELRRLVGRETVSEGRLQQVDCEDATVLQRQRETYPGISNPSTISARWTGDFIPRRSGRHRFRISSNGGIRFFVDEVKRIDQWQEAWIEGTKRQDWIDLEAGRTYRLRIEYGNWWDKQREKGGYIRFDYFEPGETATLFAEATAAAKAADVALVAVGVPLEFLQGEANDNDSFELPGNQAALVQAVAAANPRTAVLLVSNGGVDMRTWGERVPAIMELFSQGQEAGNSVADVLFGDVNPAARLPITYPTSIDQLEVELVQKQYENSVCKIGYRMFDHTGKVPQFPFGHGLSYTTFAYRDLTATPENDGVRVKCVVENTGKRAGAEVVQLYVGDVIGSVERPVRELKGFSKVFLQPGEARAVSFFLPATAFAFWSEQTHAWFVEPGDFTLEVGSSSRNLPLHTTVRR